MTGSPALVMSQVSRLVVIFDLLELVPVVVPSSLRLCIVVVAVVGPEPPRVAAVVVVVWPSSLPVCVVVVRV